MMELSAITLLVLDADGVLTDGRVVFGRDGELGKAFQVRDGCAIKLWRSCGHKIAILSGRPSAAVHHRAKELGIDFIETGAADKLAGFRSVLANADCAEAQTAYVGDDLPDLGPLTHAGFAVAVANAAPDIKRVADYVTQAKGGDGAVAEVIELLLRRQQRWSKELLRKA
jgi:3-deoxy-D-manno-octulosonate 8-phosphate phosphatase (KDO 8-P phosphatase)